VNRLDPDLIARARHWLFEQALPFWAEHGFDRHGMPYESLTLDGLSDAGEGFHRVRALARQVYVFAHADVLGWGKGKPASDRAFTWLKLHANAGVGAWHKLLYQDGSVKDQTPDLYDHAFVLFALAWRFVAYGDEEARLMAHQVLDRVEADFAHPSGLGFYHCLPPCLPRQQNPHMHLTEASLVMAGAGDQRFGALADRLVDLFKLRIVEADTGILPEYFNDDWTRVDGGAGQIVEPGHQFEWAWILARHQVLRGHDNSAVIGKLVHHAEAHGVDHQSQATYNQIWRDGRIKDGGSRTWPNTERLKGWIGLAAVMPDVDLTPANHAMRLLLDRYLDPAPVGCWIDAFDQSGRPLAKTIPASTLYHLLLAVAEASALAASAPGSIQVSGPA
jgi:mannose/cellobiose epimerase-like protein (N-acyl-D-glucosamine 2-epimerase family)